MANLDEIEIPTPEQFYQTCQGQMEGKCKEIEDTCQRMMMEVKEDMARPDVIDEKDIIKAIKLAFRNRALEGFSNISFIERSLREENINYEDVDVNFDRIKNCAIQIANERLGRDAFIPRHIDLLIRTSIKDTKIPNWKLKKIRNDNAYYGPDYEPNESNCQKYCIVQ